MFANVIKHNVTDVKLSYSQKDFIQMLAEGMAGKRADMLESLKYRCYGTILESNMVK